MLPPSRSGGGRDEGAARAVLILILVSTLVRVIFAASMGLGIDESYMVASGHRLALGYFDHPPAAWWMQWGAAHLFGTDAPSAVRAPFIAAFALSTWIMFRLGACVAGERAGLLAAVALNLSPVFGITSGTWVLPDGPLDCALLGAALCLVHALDEGSWKWWIGAGLCAGLALLSKYSAILTIAGAFAYLLSSPRRRRWLARPEPYAAGLLALLVFVPVIAWNAGHHWASFAFQGDRAEGLRFHPFRPLAVLAGEALFVLPWIWLGMALAVWRALTRRATGAGGPGEGQILLLFLAAPPILLFSLVALWSSGRVLFHWAAPGYLMLFPLLGAWLAERPALARRSVRVTTCVVLAGLALLISQVQFDWLHPAFAFRHASDPEAQAVDWTALRQKLASRKLLSPDTVVAVTNWREGGKIAYALGRDIAVTCLAKDPHEFGITAPSGSFTGRDMLVLVPSAHASQAQNLRAAFTTLTELPPLRIEHRGRGIATISAFRGTGFRGWPPPPRR